MDQALDRNDLLVRHWQEGRDSALSELMARNYRQWLMRASFAGSNPEILVAALNEAILYVSRVVREGYASGKVWTYGGFTSEVLKTTKLRYISHAQREARMEVASEEEDVAGSTPDAHFEAEVLESNEVLLARVEELDIPPLLATALRERITHDPEYGHMLRLILMGHTVVGAARIVQSETGTKWQCLNTSFYRHREKLSQVALR